jgi:hypothetical protein
MLTAVLKFRPAAFRGERNDEMPKCMLLKPITFLSTFVDNFGRRPLFRQSGVLSHDPHASSSQFKGHRGPKAKQSAFPDGSGICDVFIEPVTWMANAILSIEGKVCIFDCCSAHSSIHYIVYLVSNWSSRCLFVALWLIKYNGCLEFVRYAHEDGCNAASII